MRRWLWWPMRAIGRVVGFFIIVLWWTIVGLLLGSSRA